MAVSSSDPWAPLRVDCLSVQQGAQQGQEWAGAPELCLARVWAPLSASLDDGPERVVWMPAHCSQQAVGNKQLGNGDWLTSYDVEGNAFVDKLAKEAARADRLPRLQRKAVHELGELVAAIVTWIGQVTRLANCLPDPAWSGVGKQRRLRDSEAVRGRSTLAHSPASSRQCRQQGSASSSQQPAPSTVLYDLSGHPRWAALRQRIREKEQVAAQRQIFVSNSRG
jgi:hypothetical protein